MDEITLIHGDCLEEMKKIPDKSIDLVLTSPPYNTGNSSLGYHPNSTTGDKFYQSYNDNLSFKDYYDFIYRGIRETLRISRYAFWNMQMITNNKQVVLGVLREFHLNLKDIFIWKKVAVAQIVKGKLATGYEFVFMFGENNSMIFDYHNFPSNGYVPNIEEFYKKQTDNFKEHHAVFPREFASYFIQHFTKQDNVVLDPFMGSGTTGVACKELGRKFIGIEIDKTYFEIAKKRIENTQKELFV